MLSSSNEPKRSQPQIEKRGVDPAVKARFEKVALPHLDAVYRMARALGTDTAEADDLVQETFIRALRAFDRFELREYGAKPWLLRILHNVFYTAKGKQRRGPTLLDDVDFDHFAEEVSTASIDAGNAEAINWESFDEELKFSVQQLQPEYRSVLLLWSIEGLSYKEISEICDCALGTVMSRLYRARQLVGKQLVQYARKRGLNTQRFDVDPK